MGLYISFVLPLSHLMLPDIPDVRKLSAAGAGPGSTAPHFRDFVFRSETPSWLALTFIFFLILIAVNYLVQLTQELRYRRGAGRAANRRQAAASRGVNEVPAELV